MKNFKQFLTEATPKALIQCANEIKAQELYLNCIEFVVMMTGIDKNTIAYHIPEKLKPLNKPKVGSILYFEMTNGKLGHVALWLNKKQMIHVYGYGSQPDIVDIKAYEKKWWNITQIYDSKL